MPCGPAASLILFEDAASDHLCQLLHAQLLLPIELLLVRPLLRFEITTCLAKKLPQLVTLPGQRVDLVGRLGTHLSEFRTQLRDSLTQHCLVLLMQPLALVVSRLD